MRRRRRGSPAPPPLPKKDPSQLRARKTDAPSEGPQPLLAPLPDHLHAGAALAAAAASATSAARSRPRARMALCLALRTSPREGAYSVCAFSRAPREGSSLGSVCVSVRGAGKRSRSVGVKRSGVRMLSEGRERGRAGGREEAGGRREEGRRRRSLSPPPPAATRTPLQHPSLPASLPKHSRVQKKTPINPCNFCTRIENPPRVQPKDPERALLLPSRPARALQSQSRGVATHLTSSLSAAPPTSTNTRIRSAALL